ncbi:DUF1697 domain-containing protein [Pacificibacter sp. AS14]|uniref:DUF1697 domain-containing protein n=1 Tax=Pacificibacter sp. AS14 TaxID=3135785 RepID=UPI00316CD3A0
MTQTWIALMRGVNVGGHGKLPMLGLRTLLTGLGFDNVRTYIQSGNAVFDAAGTAEDLSTAISAAVEAAFGFHRPCFMLTASQFDHAIAGNPFDHMTDDPKTVHLMFLKGFDRFDADAFATLCTNDEVGVLEGDVFYLFTPKGFGRSKAAEKLDKVLKSDSLTARNLNSCHKIAALAHT